MIIKVHFIILLKVTLNKNGKYNKINTTTKNNNLNTLNKNQIDFFNTLYDDVNRTSNKIEKEIKYEVLHQL